MCERRMRTKGAITSRCFTTARVSINVKLLIQKTLSSVQCKSIKVDFKTLENLIMLKNSTTKAANLKLHGVHCDAMNRSRALGLKYAEHLWNVSVLQRVRVCTCVNRFLKPLPPTQSVVPLLCRPDSPIITTREQDI